MFPEPGSTGPRRSARDVDYSAGAKSRGISGAFAATTDLRTGRVTGCVSRGVPGALTRSRPGALRMLPAVNRQGPNRGAQEISGRER